MEQADAAPEINEGLEEDKRNTPDFWRKWIKSAEKAGDKHRRRALQAWTEYEKGESQEDAGDGRPYPIYWASCKTLEPAYYSRTPKILSKRRGGTNDSVALTMSLIVERLGDALVDGCDFDDVMQAGVLDFIHADKACTQVKYEEVPKRIPPPLDATGLPMLDAAGLPMQERVVMLPSVCLMPCSYDEVLHTPDAKSEAEINEKAYYFFMPRDEAEKRFLGKSINWKKGERAKRGVDEVGQDRDRPAPTGEYLEGWECWCKSTKTVYWISEQCQDGFLDSKEDPYHLRGFFPSTKFIIGSRPSKHLYPTPVYTQLKSQIEELHSAEVRVSVLIDRVRRRALIDGANDELVHALNNLGDAEYVGCENLQQVLEKGGLDNMVWFIPVKELVDAIGELSSFQEKFKNQFFEWFGIPDILRGATDPLETAAAQELKSGAANDRFKFPKKLIARMARDSIDLMIDMALQQFTDEEIAKIVNFDTMEPEHQGRFAEAVAALRSEDVRNVRVDIDSDSMSFLDDQLRAQKVEKGMGMLTTGLQQIAQIVETSPDYANIMLQALLLSLESIGLGKEFEDMVRASVNALIDKAKNPPEPPPPPPDYEMLKIQVAQAKVDYAAQARQRELDQADWRLQQQQQQALWKAQNDAQALQIKEYKVQLDQAVQNFMMQIEAQRLQIESFKAQMQARESEMEEIRLAREAQVAEYRAINGLTEAEPPQSQTPPVINIIQPPATSVIQAPAPNVLVQAPDPTPVINPNIIVR